MRIKLTDIIAENDDLQTLEALKEKLAESIDNSNSGRDIAALSRQLTQVIEKIRELKEHDTTNDEISEILATRAKKHKNDKVRGANRFE